MQLEKKTTVWVIKGGLSLDSIDYYNRYAVPYYEETVDASMEEVMKPFVELLSEE